MPYVHQVRPSRRLDFADEANRLIIHTQKVSPSPIATTTCLGSFGSGDGSVGD